MTGRSLNRGAGCGDTVNTPTVDLIGTSVSALVHAISATERLTGLPVTVIGGLAVVCRLSRPYRTTSDMDIVDRRRAEWPNQLELLVAASTPAVDRAGAIVPTPLGDVNVDVLQVSDADFRR